MLVCAFWRFAGFYAFEKKQPPLLASYRETPSSVSLFTDFGGASDTFAGVCHFSGLAAWDLPTRGLPNSLSGAHDVSLWCPSAVLQALWCCSSKSRHGPSFSSAPGHPSVSALSAPQVRRNTNQSLVQPFRKLEHQTLTLLLPPKNEASRGHLGLTAEPHQSLQVLSAKPCQFHQHSSESGESNQSLGHLWKLELQVNLPSPLSLLHDGKLSQRLAVLAQGGVVAGEVKQLFSPASVWPFPALPWPGSATREAFLTGF